jgi:alpha-mannosidase
MPAGQIEIEWALPAQGRSIDLHFRYHKQEKSNLEAAYVAFPLALPEARVLSDSQLGWVDWDRDGMPGSCKEWLPLQTGVFINGQDMDIFIASPDVPLFCVGDIVRGNWPEKLNLTGGRIFSYVFNNYWRTNYKASQSGDISFHYQMTSADSIPFDQAFRQGMSARQPLIVQRISLQEFRSPNLPYDLPGGGTLAQIGPDQIHLSTMKRARYAPGMILRLQETSGQNCTAKIGFPGKPILQAWMTDLLEYDLEPLPVEPNGNLLVNVPAWGLATVRIVLAESTRMDGEG